MSRRCARMLAATLALALAACTQVRNPATGELQYTSLTPQQEKALGREEHPKALAQFGGQYPIAMPRPMSSGSATGSRTRPS